MCKDGDVLSLLVLISREASSLSSQQRVRVPVGNFPLQGIQLSCSLHFQPPTRFGTGPGEHTRAPRVQNATGRAGIRRRLIHIPGGHRRRVTPVPIPNTEVKPSTADGTARATAWESRSLPGVFLEGPMS